MGKLNEIYEKDITREIQGVIKVDDENYIKQELEEYVVTDELLKHFNSFFESYNAGINGNTEKMGVWISGFFGSGKSHFLKIRAVCLKPRKSFQAERIKHRKICLSLRRSFSSPEVFHVVIMR